MFEAIGEGITVTDLEGNIVEANEALLRMSGYGCKEELIGRNGLQFIAEKDRAKAVEDMMKAVDGGYGAAREYTFVGKDGREFDAEASGSLLRDSTGNPSGFISVIRDITERKQAEELFKSLTSSSPIGIYVVQDGKFQFVNAQFQKYAGYSEDELLGMDSLSFVFPDERNRVRENAVKMLKGERSIPYEYQFVNKEGEVRWIMETVVPIQYLGRRAALGNFMDITERDRAEEALRESEEKYRALVDHMEEGYLVFRGGRIRYANRRCAEVIGIPVKKLIGEDYWRFLAPESQEQARQTYETLTGGGKVHPIQEYVYLTEAGRRIPVETSMREITYEGKPSYAVVWRDITERKRAEEALRKSEEQFRALIENAQDAIVIVNPDITISYQSPSMGRMTGRKAKDRIGKDPLQYCHPDDISEVAEAFLQLFENKIPTVHTEFRYRHKDGRWRIFEVVGNNLIDDPAVGGIVLNMRDITERKQAEEEVRKLNEGLEQRVVERTVQLQAVNKELEAFAYSVSHDLRAPLRSIDGFSQVLLEDYTDRLDDEGKNYLQRVRSASQRMAELIDDLLNLSRVTRGKMHYETVDLSALAQTIAMELRQSQPERDVEFTIAPGLAAKGDAQLLSVALENLLGNSWKFAKKRGRTRIEFGYAETNGQPAYFVRDNGVGFDMAYADKLFGAFQRLHSHNEFEGTGIGLATVQRIIHRHGGKIWAESAVGQGATFYFTL
ncbi:MAG: PAS domain S-box protein [Dehalococcoidia bacterium]|nr:PAS domain S-box protein [Dehalococcoidia bacterium]